jgi:hypothetical protein
MSEDDETPPAAQIAARIAKNRQIEERVLAKRAGSSLDGIAASLDANGQRATYGTSTILTELPLEKPCQNATYPYNKKAKGWLRPMLGHRSGIVALITLVLPSFCLADTTITFLDLGDTVRWSFMPDSSNPQSCGVTPNPEFCSIGTSPFIGTPFSLLFNIYEPNRVTLSDTLQVFNPVGSTGVFATFQSDIEGSTLVPLVNGTTIIEDGTVQTAASVPLGGTGGTFTVRFQSDLDPVPEPRFIGLLSLAMLGIVVAAKRRATI